jgi:hypothetical protein
MNDTGHDDPSATPPAPTTGNAPTTLYLSANEWNGGYHLVSQATVDRATADHEAVEAAPYYENYGELRLSGDLDELSERSATTASRLRNTPPRSSGPPGKLPIPA